MTPDQINSVIKWKEKHYKEYSGHIHKFAITFLEKDNDPSLDVPGCLPIIECIKCKQKSIIFVSMEAEENSEKFLKEKTFKNTICMGYSEALLECEKLHKRLDYGLTSLNYQQQNGMFDSLYDSESEQKHVTDCLDVIWDVITALGFEKHFTQTDYFYGK